MTCSRYRVPGSLMGVVLILGLGIPANGGFINDDFEGYAQGTFPSPPWLDVGLVDPTPPDPPIPSATVQLTTDPFGQPTQALAVVEALAPSQGIYQMIPATTDYYVAGDLRVDRFSDNAASATSDWAIQLSVGKVEGQLDFAYVPQVGIYASSFTQGWRLYAVGAAGAFADIDLSLGVDVGRWYQAEMELNALTGVVTSRIRDAATGNLLVDQTDAIPDWTAADGPFDFVGAFDGELTEAATVSNLAVVDNIVYVPEPATQVLVFIGGLTAVRYLLRRRLLAASAPRPVA